MTKRLISKRLVRAALAKRKLTLIRRNGEWIVGNERFPSLRAVCQKFKIRMVRH